MKRYLVFFGDDYYPFGGMDDFLSDFDTIEECKLAIANEMKVGFKPHRESLEEYIQTQQADKWAHIYDTQTRQKIWSK